jgi:hypothetical protein
VYIRVHSRLDDPGRQVRGGLAFGSSRPLCPSAWVRTYIYRYLKVRRLGVLRVELGRRRRFGRGQLFFRFVGGRPTSEEALDHVKGDRNEEDGDG